MYVVTLDPEKCWGCGACVKVCPSKAFVLVEEEGRTYALCEGDPCDCTGCYSCEVSCEDGAIQVLDL